MNPKKPPKLVSILGLTLLTAIVWVSFEVFRALTNKPSPPVPQEITNPLTPSLDTETLDKIQSQIYIDSSQIADNVIIQETPSPSPNAAPVSTPAAENTQTNESTSSAEVTTESTTSGTLETGTIQ